MLFLSKIQFEVLARCRKRLTNYFSTDKFDRLHSTDFRMFFLNLSAEKKTNSTGKKVTNPLRECENILYDDILIR